ncbi:MAG: HlyD family efflux transporter periplasmic adaptor subunit [Gemmatimonadaceae bacterium]
MNRRWGVRPLLTFAVLTLPGACAKEGADAYGNFEATEVTVAAETSGRLLKLAAREGARVAAGERVGLVDTSAIVLQRAELVARRDAARARTGEVDANAATLRTQLDVAVRELERTKRLLAAQAATPQQADRAARDADVLRDQLNGVGAARSSAAREVAAIDAQLASLDDRLRKSHVVAPAAGTVLTRVAEPGEFVSPGTPLFTMAALDTLMLRVYLSGAQLSQVALGNVVQVRVDAGSDSLRTLQGRVTWIASSAEFTPTPIQTRDERTTLVYAVKIAVPNEGGRLRIGMPGEVMLGTVTSGTRGTP